ncbi:MAG: RnfABCDGE type electron transport complex subunit D [Clostridia bacterium]|nr:RnfABCDGE type electron transport complex subunit D [Clostridia bacterium]
MSEQNKLHISVSPHISNPRTTASIMLDVIIALLPTALAGIIIFGIRALAVIAVSIAAAVASESIFCIIVKKENTVPDLSSVVTGFILALNLPVSIPLWQAAVGSVFAIIVVKCLFGGIGQNFANPAMTARIFMITAFAATASVAYPTIVDTTSVATPLVELGYGLLPESFLGLFLGTVGGAIGEVSSLAILIGFVYLLVRKVIRPFAPISFVLTVFIFSLIFEGFDLTYALAWTLSGGLLFGAVFMATDYSTTPITDVGKIIFGVGAGFITVVIRFFGSYPEGVSFGILFMNILTPYIDKLVVNKPFGGKIR